ncbi:hypothetical protein [Quadrisphaera sp. KR29]|uniref:hypothetical protein n=1 Tax=Quadrisphaera sp. KR29 TaxID=3461391 RepID=UPI004043A2FD
MTLAAAGVLGVTSAGAAQASAYGASPIAPFSYTDATSGLTRSVPYGCVLIHKISGTGTSITAQTATVDCAGVAAMRNGLFCDVRVDFTYTDLTGRSETHHKASLPGCRTLGIRLTNTDMPDEVDAGRACATLYVARERRASSCHVISG